MSKYTTEVRFICESASGLTESTGFDNVEEVLENCVANVFNFPFPIFDENYRKILEKKILRHYYTREIGFETVGLWKLKLSAKLNDIMPYYNQLYQSEIYEFNPFDDVDFTREFYRTLDGASSGTSNATSDAWNKFSDTPQGSISGLEDDEYLTNATHNEGYRDDSYDNTNNNVEHYTETTKGKQGTKNYADILKKYRQTFLNIDMQIIEELNDLFFGLW